MPCGILRVDEVGDLEAAGGVRKPEIRNLMTTQKISQVSRFRCRHSFCVFAVFVLVTGIERNARAQTPIPDNDSFATRIPIYGTNVSTTGRNTGATFELGEP